MNNGGYILSGIALLSTAATIALTSRLNSDNRDKGDQLSDQTFVLWSKLIELQNALSHEEVYISATKLFSQFVDTEDVKIILLDEYGDEYGAVNQEGGSHSFGLGQQCVSTGSSIIVNDSAQVPAAYASRVRNILITPIFTASKVTGFIIAVNKLKGHFTEYDRNISAQLSGCISAVSSRLTLIENERREKMRVNAIVSILRARQSDGPLSDMWKMAIKCVTDLFSPELASIFVCDHINCEVFNVATKDSENIEGLTLPFGKGFVGAVAENGRGIRTENAYRDPRFCKQVDVYTGQHTRSILCLPIPGFQRNSRPIAVVQVINRKDGKNFSEADELALASICDELSLLLRWKSTELNDLRHRIKRLHVLHYEELEVSILKEYGASGALRTDLETASKRVHMDAHFERAPSAGEEIIMLSTELMALITNHNTDPFLLSDSVMIELGIQMISSYGLIDKFHMNVQDLRNFLMLVKAKYRPTNAFHNFKHAWGVMHLSYMILHYGAENYLNDLDILALLLSAICHDLDHPGNNNAFEIAIRSELAILYSDDAVLERHHLAVTHELLENPSTQILSGLTPSQRSDLRASMTSAILATDMSQHFKILEDIIKRTSTDTPYSSQDPVARRALIGHILHSADIGAQTQCKEVALKWTDRLVAEFSAQAQREIECNIPLTPFLHGLDDELKKMQLQVGFLNGVVSPLWVALAAVFPEMEPAICQLEANKNYYTGEVDRITALRAAAEAANVATAAESASTSTKN